jgi:uncharacterized protein (TIGR00297 family)
MAALLWSAGGWGWLAPPLTFLLLTGVWTRWPGRSRRDRTRRLRQVAANGLPSTAVGLAALLGLQEDAAALMVAGSFAAAAGDTWATEWGGAFGGRPLSLRSFRRVCPGTSGAVSLPGTFASLAGAGSVALAGWLAGMYGVCAAWIVVLAGVAGSLLDSIAGAWLQQRWAGPAGEDLEEKGRAGEPARRVRGLPGVDNDVVNLLATSAGALVPLILTI